MKTIHVIIAVTLIFMIKAQARGFENVEYNCTAFAPKDDSTSSFKVGGQGNPAFSLDFCRSILLEDKYAKCCFLKYKEHDKRRFHCYPVTASELSDIDENLVDKVKDHYDDVSLDCNSRYLFAPLILIATLLLI